MRTEYRIANFNGTLYFPQVRVMGFFWWGKWKRIGKHNTGYGLYPSNDYDYPKTKEEASDIIESFNKWYKTPKKPFYINYTLKTNK